MAAIEVLDLQYKYSWNAIPPDDPRVTGKPDSTFLNRNEGYEVLAFLNRIAGMCPRTPKGSALQAERMIQTGLPGNIRSHANVLKWLIENWSSYQ